MYWRISQFPELDHLSPEARRRLLRRVAWRAYLWIIPASVVIGGLLAGCLGTFAAPWLYAPASVAKADGRWLQLVLMLAGGFAILAYRFQIRFIRNVMRHTIAEGFRGQRPPFCLGCGYDLTGQASAKCPECGRNLEPAGTPNSTTGTS